MDQSVVIMIFATGSEPRLPLAIRAAERSGAESGHEYYIVLVGDALSLATHSAVLQFHNNPHITLRLCSTRRGKARSLAEEVALRKESYFLLTDGDALLTTDTTQWLLAALIESEAGAVAGRVISERVPGRSAGAYELHTEAWHRYRLTAESSHLWPLPGPIYAITRRVARKIKHLQPVINEDSAVGCLSLRAGWRLVYEPRATVTVCPPQNWQDYFRQRVRCRIGWLELVAMNVLPLREMLRFQVALRTCARDLNSRFDEWLAWRAADGASWRFAQALSSLLGHKRFHLWKPVKSTKEIAAE